jgi:hypothetical protein
MIGLIKGRLVSFAITLILFILYLYYLNQAKTKAPPVRRLPPIDAMEEGVGRAVELGRPVHWTPGYGSAEHAGGVGSRQGLTILSGITILGYVARICASRGAELIATFANPELVPLATDLVRDAYLAENKIEDFKQENIRFISSRQYAFASGILGIFQREQIGTNIMTGAFGADALLIAEGAHGVNAFQVAGSNSTYQLPVLVTICDYTLIGEELFAAAAYLSPEALQRGALRAADIAKFGFILLAIIGLVLGATGVNLLSDLLKL